MITPFGGDQRKKVDELITLFLKEVNRVADYQQSSWNKKFYNAVTDTKYSPSG